MQVFADFPKLRKSPCETLEAGEGSTFNRASNLKTKSKIQGNGLGQRISK